MAVDLSVPGLIVDVFVASFVASAAKRAVRQSGCFVALLLLNHERKGSLLVCMLD